MVAPAPISAVATGTTIAVVNAFRIRRRNDSDRGRFPAATPVLGTADNLVVLEFQYRELVLAGVSRYILGYP
jgi:hypothetical protein